MIIEHLEINEYVICVIAIAYVVMRFISRR